jgi:hypothetical protein
MNAAMTPRNNGITIHSASLLAARKVDGGLMAALASADSGNAKKRMSQTSAPRLDREPITRARSSIRFERCIAVSNCSVVLTLSAGKLDERTTYS